MLSIVVMDILLFNEFFFFFNQLVSGYGNILKKNVNYLPYCDHLKFSAFTFFKKKYILTID